MNNGFFRKVSNLIPNTSLSNIILVSGNNNNQNYPVGYGGDYQNPGGGAKQQLLTLIRSVRTVMRGKDLFILFNFYFFFIF